MHSEKITPIPIQQFCETGYATVHSIEVNQFTLQAHHSTIIANKSFSCLLQPEIGDEVMYSRNETNQNYILSILHRPRESTAKIEMESDLVISSSKGKVSILANQALQMVSAEQLDLLSSKINMVSQQATVSINKTNLSGDSVNANVTHLNVIAQSISTVANHLTQKLQNSFRLISGMDQSKAGNVMTSVKNLFSVHARQSAILAKDDVKIDAKRIHMG